MKHIAIALLLALPSCGLVNDINWPEVAKCGPSTSDLIGVVSEILLSGVDYREALTDVARRKGTTTVLCIVEQLRADWSAAGSAMPPEHVTAAAKAQAFIDYTGSRVER